MKRILLSLGGVALSLLIAAPAAAATAQQNFELVQPKKMIIKSGATSTGGGTDSTTKNKSGGRGKTTKCIEGAPCVVNACTTGTCKSGECVLGKADSSKCNDKNECTKDVCTEKRGCLHTNQSEGTPCAADKNACTIDKCNRKGECKTVDTKKCDDGKFCTIDTCDKAEGTCKFTKNPDPGCCEPGTQDKAGKDDACKVGITCTQDGKWPEPVWSTNGTSCDDTDQNACTVATCSGGGCNQRGQIKVACSLASDGCCPSGCNATNDGDCQPRCGNGVKEGNEQCDVSIATCAANQYGLGATGCDTSLCTCIYPPGECQPGQTQNVGTQFCTGVKTCDSTGHWGAASFTSTNGYSCSDGQDCTTGDQCSNGLCAGTPSCDDGNRCTADGCNANGQCAHTLNSQLCQCQPGAVQPADSAYPCDVESVCRNGQWVKDYSKNSTTVCRSKQGDCDVAEKCDGATSTCPGDAVQPAGEVCRLARAGDPCDLPETCDGASAACPQEDLRRRDYTFDQTLTARPLAEAATGTETLPQTLTQYRTLSDYQMFNIAPKDTVSPQDTISPDTLSQLSQLSVSTMKKTSTPQFFAVAPLTAELIAQAIARANDRCTIRSCNADGRYAETPRECAATSDGCCPAGCNTNTDGDCTADCGNGVVEDGEVCDQGISSPGAPGRCPATSADCSDNLPYTIDSVENINSCNATCTHVTDTSHCYIPQGDGTSSEVSIGTINDQNQCEICAPTLNPTGWTQRPAGTEVGTPTTCHLADACDGAGHLVAGGWIQAAAGDGCCNPADGANDSDCALCGNGTLDNGETCDTAISPSLINISGVCPTTSSCDDKDPTTTDTLQSGGTCQAHCSHEVERCYILGTYTPGQYQPYMQDYSPGYNTPGGQYTPGSQYTPGGTYPTGGQGPLYDPGQVNPNNPCEYCDLSSPTSWSHVQDNTQCGGDPCAPRFCSQGVCGEPQPIACLDDECHKGGACEKETGICVYAETTECPAPETAVCDGAKLDPGEFCDGAFGCGADQTCAECKKCVDKDKPTTASDASAITAKAFCLGASPKVAEANQKLLAAGVDNRIFCEVETGATACFVITSVGKALSTSLDSAGWEFTQTHGRNPELVAMPKAIDKPVAILKSAGVPVKPSIATTAGTAPLAVEQLSTGIPNANMEEINGQFLINSGTVSFGKVAASSGQQAYDPVISKNTLTLDAKGSASGSSAAEATDRILCVTHQRAPVWLQADGGEPDAVYDLPRTLELLLQKTPASTAGSWSDPDVYTYAFSSSALKQALSTPPAGVSEQLYVEGSSPKAMTSSQPALSFYVYTLAGEPASGPSTCMIIPSVTNRNSAGLLLIAMLMFLAPAGALVAVRVRERRRK